MSDLISRETVKEKFCIDDNSFMGARLNSIPSADIMECARAMKEYCEKHRNEHNFYMCGTCEYSSSEYSSFLHEKPFKCPFNVPAYWDLPEPHRTESGEV